MTEGQFIKEVERAQGPLRRFLRVLCGGDGFAADDIAQDALMKAWLHFGDFSGRSRFTTWLYRIAYNCWYDSRCHGRGGRQNLLSLDEAVACEIHGDDAGCPDRYAELYQAIDGLSGAEKIVVLLFYMEERSVKEIEMITGFPSGTVRSHLSRARNHLRKSLETIDKI